MTRTPKGMYKCRVCDEFFPKDEHDRRVCPSCLQQTSTCQNCGVTIPKYRVDGQLRSVCSVKCASKLYWQTKEARQARSEQAKAAWQNPARRQQLSEHMQRRWANPESRKRIRTALDKARSVVWSIPENRQKVLEGLRRSWTLGRRRRLSKWNRARWESGEARPFGSLKEKLETGYRTNIETLVEQGLISLGIDYDFEHRVGRYWVDFAIKPLCQKIAIECDGVRYHQDEVREKERDQYLSRRGWRVLHLPGQAIREDALRLLIEKLYPLLDEEPPFHQLALPIK
jgi:very-short-patch-repair endonuclease